MKKKMFCSWFYFKSGRKNEVFPVRERDRKKVTEKIPARVMKHRLLPRGEGMVGRGKE